MAVHPTWKKENNSAEKEGFSFSMLLLPLPLARTKENGNIESRILINFAPCTMILVYTLPAARKRLLLTWPYSEVLYEMNLQESRIILSKISTPCLIFLISFVIINAEIWQWILRIFKPRLAVTFIFPPCKKIYNKYEE